jgi:LysM domain
MSGGVPEGIATTSPGQHRSFKGSRSHSLPIAHTFFFSSLYFTPFSLPHSLFQAFYRYHHDCPDFCSCTRRSTFLYTMCVAHYSYRKYFNVLYIIAALAANCARTYTVKAGDICDSISAAQHVSTFVYLTTRPCHLSLHALFSYQLAVTNAGIINSGCSNLVPGQTICLGNVGEDCTTTHVVAVGDTCDGINRAAGINNTMLYGNNPQINQACTNIYIGEVRIVHPRQSFSYS